MPTRAPEGGRAVHTGELPAGCLEGLGGRPFGVYMQMPFCAATCGYCDFNTYTASELADSGASIPGWRAALRAELKLAARVPGNPPAADTVFVGGGTPSLLGGGGLAAVLDAVRDTFGLAPGAEVSTERTPSPPRQSSSRR